MSIAMGTVAGLLAGAMAFLIFYNEYQKHRFSTSRLWRESLKGALVAFLFFLVLAIVAGLWLSAVLRRSF
jgi:uncharacterized membrane protein SpoIIM required for sporulation